MPDLTDKQQAFIAHYVVCLNGAEAARRAGYAPTSARQMASENLSKPHIRDAIDAQLAALTMPKGEVLARLTEHARGSMADFLSTRGRTVTLDLKQAAAAGVLHLIKKYAKTKQGVSIELYDAQAALTLLGKQQGMFKDTDLMKYIDLAKLNDTQIERLSNGDDPLAVILNK